MASSKAASVPGSEDLARQWMRRRAIGLNRHVPAELVGAVAGAELVQTFLDQLGYGVYV